MKKGLYLSINLRKTSIAFFSLMLVTSFICAVHYMSLSVATSNILPLEPVIIVDAGHGGIDGGAQSSTGISEKDINISISKKIGNLLSLMGYKVIYTRDNDDIPYPESCKTTRQRKVWDIHRRLDIMKENSNCIFLSIHQNHFTQSKYSGAQVFYSHTMPESKSVAECIQQAIVANIQNDNTRQIKQSGSEIYLLYNAVSPAVMVECGFLSNAGEALLLNDDSYQSKMSLSIVQGLTQYLKSVT